MPRVFVHRFPNETILVHDLDKDPARCQPGEAFRVVAPGEKYARWPFAVLVKFLDREVDLEGIPTDPTMVGPTGFVYPDPAEAWLELKQRAPDGTITIAVVARTGCIACGILVDVAAGEAVLGIPYATLATLRMNHRYSPKGLQHVHRRRSGVRLDVSGLAFEPAQKLISEVWAKRGIDESATTPHVRAAELRTTAENERGSHEN